MRVSYGLSGRKTPGNLEGSMCVVSVPTRMLPERVSQPLAVPSVPHAVPCSVAKARLTLGDSIDCSMPGFWEGVLPLVVLCNGDQ